MPPLEPTDEADAQGRLLASDAAPAVSFINSMDIDGDVAVISNSNSANPYVFERVRSSGAGQPDSACAAALVPTATTGIAVASCALPATAAPLTIGLTRTLTAHFDPDVNSNIDIENPLIDELRGPYTGSNGQPHPQTQAALVVVGDRLFCNGYETVAIGGCPVP